MIIGTGDPMVNGESIAKKVIYLELSIKEVYSQREGIKRGGADVTDCKTVHEGQESSGCTSDF